MLRLSIQDPRNRKWLTLNTVLVAPSALALLFMIFPDQSIDPETYQMRPDDWTREILIIGGACALGVLSLVVHELIYRSWIKHSPTVT